MARWCWRQLSPGYHAGDLRFIDFKSERDFLISDEMGSLTMSGDTIFHAHWLALYSYRMTDRSASRGASYGNPISTERRPPIVNRGSSEPDWVTYSPGPNHHADGTIIQAHREGRTFQDAFWVFFNALDPPYAGGNTYGDGYKGRYAIIHDGTIYYQTNGGSIFAVGTGSSGSVYVPPDDEPGTNPRPPTHTLQPTTHQPAARRAPDSTCRRSCGAARRPGGRFAATTPSGVASDPGVLL